VFEAAKATHQQADYQLSSTTPTPSAIMKSLSLALTLLASSTAQETCMPPVRSVGIGQSTTARIHMFEVVVMDANEVNWASPLVNPKAVASQSSTSNFEASLAIDGDISTHSETDADSANNKTQWWSVDLGEVRTVTEVRIEN
jgi:hypothetical protein